MRFSTITILFQLSLFASLVYTQSQISFVDPNVVLQKEFKGWGTSLAWWAEMIGGMEEEVINHVVDALFSPSKLNLNIARYVIGGTTPDYFPCGDFRDGAATESYKDGPDKPYDWSRDPRQRKILQLAKAKGANIFEAFSNSPPQWLNINGCSKGNLGNPPLHSNFDPVNASLFADYATEVLKYFHEEFNVTFSTYAPFNEPYGLHGVGGWMGTLTKQEGCNMNRATMTEVIKKMHESLTEKNLNFVKLSISDETQVNTQIQTYDYFMDAGVGAMFSQVNTHGYWENFEVSRKDLLSLKCEQAGHELWMDEMGWTGTPTDDMEQGLNIATRIVSDLQNMLPSAWVYWLVVEDGGWGLLDVPYHNASLDKIRYNSGYYAMKQFSLHIKQGYELVYISELNSVAAKSEKEQKLVIVTVNPNDQEVAHEFNLGLVESLGTLELSRTSGTEQHLNLPPPNITAGNRIELRSPPHSISTLEFSNVKFFASLDNLIQNGDFEMVSNSSDGSLLPVSWTVQGQSNGATTDIAWRGKYSGVLELSVGKHASLSQIVELSSASAGSCTLHLSAWCLSTLAGTKLTMTSNSTEDAVEVEINRNGAYSSYGLSLPVPVTSGETVEISFLNSGAALVGGTAKIDNVYLHAKCD